MAAQFDILAKLRADSTQFVKGMKEGQIASQNFTSAIGGMNAGIGVGIAASVAVAGVALFKLGEKFHEAYKTIRVATGATGDELKSLEGSFKAVFANTPASMKDVASVLSDLNVKLGLTGKPLEDLSLQMLKLTRITGTDLKGNTEAVTSVFKNFGIGAADQKSKLDLLFRASQESGVSVAQLASTMASAGVVLRSTGFDFDKSAAFVAVLAKAGVEASDVMPAMTRALKTAGSSGKDASVMFQETYASIQNASSASEAYAKASEVFGGRAGPKFAALIREGKLSIDEFTNGIVNGSDTIGKAAGDVTTVGGQLSKFSHQVMLAFEPLGTAIYDLVNKGLKVLGPVLASVAGAIGSAVESFQSLPGPIKAIIPIVTAAVLAMKGFVVVKGVLMGLGTSVTGIFTSLGSTIGVWTAEFLTSMGIAEEGAIAAGVVIQEALLPITIVLGAAFVAYTLFTQSSRDSEKAQKEYAETLDKTTGAITEQSKQLTLNKLEHEKVLDKMNDAGITIDKVTGFIQNHNAERVKQGQLEHMWHMTLDASRVSVEKGEASRQKYAEQLRQMGGSNNEFLASLMEVNGLNQDVIDTLYDEADAYEKKQAQLMAIEVAQGVANGLSKDAATANALEAQKNREAADEIKRKRDELKASFDPLFANMKALTDVAKAHKEYNDAVASGASAQDIRDKYDAYVAATGAYADSLDDLRIAFNKGEITGDRLRERLDVLKKLGVDTNSAAFRDLAARVDYAAGAVAGLGVPSVQAQAALQVLKETGLDPTNESARNALKTLQDLGFVAKKEIDGSVVAIKVELNSWKFWSDIGAINAWMATLDPATRDRVAINIAGIRAAGGPVASGSTYLVGEKGPELFVPNQSGRIIANNALGGLGSKMSPVAGGGSTKVYNVNVSADATTDKAALGQAVVEAIRKYEQRAGSGWRS